MFANVLDCKKKKICRNFNLNSYVPEKYSFACLTLLHPERPKLYGVLAFLSAIGLRKLSSHLLYQEEATEGSLSGIVLTNVYPLRLTEFLIDKTAYFDETSHKHTS